MKEIIISNGTFKHDNKKLDFIGIFEESKGYSIYYLDNKHTEFKEDGTEILDPTYINPLGILLDKSNGFITLFDEIENPNKFYNILTGGVESEELDYIHKLAHHIGYTIAPALEIKVYSDEFKYNLIYDGKGELIKLPNGEPYKEWYREQLVTDEALTELGIAFLTRIVGTLKFKRFNSGYNLDELDQLALKIVTPILEELKLEELEELKASLVPRLLDGTKPTKTRKELASYLEDKHGIILRKDSGELYKREPTGYSFISLDDLIILLSMI